jgi:hypothetical protein
LFGSLSVQVLLTRLNSSERCFPRRLFHSPSSLTPHPSPFLKIFPVLAALLLSCAGVPATGPRFLVIRDADSGRLYGKWPVAGEVADGVAGTFAVEFIHSVNNSPVRETFALHHDGSITAREARFFSFGAGMQSDLGEGQRLVRDGDALVITGITEAPRGELNYIVGTVSDHLLYINGGRVSLRELCGRNAHISIRGE